MSYLRVSKLNKPHRRLLEPVIYIYIYIHARPFSKSSRSLSDVYILLELLRQSSIVTSFTFRHWEPFNAKNPHKIHVKIKILFEPQDNLHIIYTILYIFVLLNVPPPLIKYPPVFRNRLTCFISFILCLSHFIFS